MSVQKISISVPTEVLATVDRLAGEAAKPRSTFITDLLRKVAVASRDAEITRRVNEVFADPEVVQEQKRTADLFARGGGSRETDKW